MTQSESSLPDQTKRKPSRKSGSKSHLHRVFWRWHFYAGFITAPFVIILSITGMIYLFSAEIEGFLRRCEVFIESGDEQLPVADLLSAAKDRYPDRQPVNLLIPPEENRSVIVTMQTDDGVHEEILFVDPYRGVITGHFDHHNDPLHRFFELNLDFHRSLFVGTIGRIVTEVVTCWIVILLVTGTVLWVPRKWSQIKGVWLIRTDKKRYTLLRDLHSVGAVYLLPILFLITGTGLFYTVGLGSLVVVANVVSAEGIEGLSKVLIPPKIETNKEVPLANENDFEIARKIARRHYPNRTLMFQIKGAKKSSLGVSAINDYAVGTYGPMRSSQMVIDAGNQTISKTDHLSENAAYWWHGWVYPLHVGSFFGPFTKILWLIACLVMLMLPITGIWMWWKRRPNGRTGIPKRIEHPLPRWVLLAIISFSIAMPLAGISILLVLGFDKILRMLATRMSALDSTSRN